MIEEVKDMVFFPNLGKTEKEKRDYRKQAYAFTLAVLLGGEVAEFFDYDSMENLDEKVEMLEALYKKETTLEELGERKYTLLEGCQKPGDGEEVISLW